MIQLHLTGNVLQTNIKQIFNVVSKCFIISDSSLICIDFLLFDNDIDIDAGLCLLEPVDEDLC